MPKCCAEMRKTCAGKLTTRQRQSQVAAAVWMHCTNQMLAKQIQCIPVGGDQHVPTRGETCSVTGAKGQECFTRALPAQPAIGRTWC